MPTPTGIELEQAKNNRDALLNDKEHCYQAEPFKPVEKPETGNYITEQKQALQPYNMERDRDEEEENNYFDYL